MARKTRHPQREAIEADLAEGWPSLREIGARYGVSKDSLFRHSSAHMDGASDGGPQDQPRQDREASPVAESPKAPPIDRERLKTRLARLRKALISRRGMFVAGGVKKGKV